MKLEHLKMEFDTSNAGILCTPQFNYTIVGKPNRKKVTKLMLRKIPPVKKLNIVLTPSNEEKDKDERKAVKIGEDDKEAENLEI